MVKLGFLMLSLMVLLLLSSFFWKSWLLSYWERLKGLSLQVMHLFCFYFDGSLQCSCCYSLVSCCDVYSKSSTKIMIHPHLPRWLLLTPEKKTHSVLLLWNSKVCQSILWWSFSHSYSNPSLFTALNFHVF